MADYKPSDFFKPADFFVGVVDLFAILLPGGILAFVVQDFASPFIAASFPQLTGQLPASVAFVVMSYVLGHLVFALSAKPLDDWFYDGWYVKRPRKTRTVGTYTYTSPPSDALQNMKKASGRRGKQFTGSVEGGILSISNEGMDMTRITHVYFGKELARHHQEGTTADTLRVQIPPRQNSATVTVTIAQDALLAHAGQLQKRQYAVGSSFITTFDWATAAVRSQSPAAITEIDRVEADSKFFRSLTLVLPVLAAYTLVYKKVWHLPGDLLQFGALVLICLALLGFSAWRYAQQRFKRTKLTYQYYIALETAAQVGQSTSGRPASDVIATLLKSS